MRIIEWNPLVNKKLILDGEYGYAEDYVSSVEFDSGKKRIFLKNNYVPKVYNSVSLILDNKTPVIDDPIENTEFWQFKKWYEGNLGYGVLPFYFPLIGRPPGIGDGIYKFIPGSVFYDDTDGIIFASFGIEEVSVTDIYIVTEDGDLLITEDNEKLIARK